MDDDELTPEQKFAADEAESMVPRALVLGKPPEEIVEDLVRLDWSRAAAQAFVTKAVAELKQIRESPQARQAIVDRARRQFTTGMLLLLVGVVFVAFTLLAAMTNRYLFLGMSIGVVVVGLALAGKGWSRWRFYGRLAAQMTRSEARDSTAASDNTSPSP